MQSNKTYILYVVFFFHMKTSRQNCRPVCLVTERAQDCDTSALVKQLSQPQAFQAGWIEHSILFSVL